MSSTRAFCFVMTILIGCGGGRGSEPTHAPSLSAAVEAARVRMHVRYEAAQRIEEFIARSALVRASVEADSIVQLHDPDALPVWAPYLEAVSGAARQIELTGDIVTAARTTAALGQACARCHQATSAHIVFASVPEPIDDKTVPKMLGHQWSAARMWEGLIGPSEERWREGAQALTGMPLELVAAGPRESGTWIADDVPQIRLYASRALEAKDLDARTQIFGMVLATCAHCHAVIRDR